MAHFWNIGIKWIIWFLFFFFSFQYSTRIFKFNHTIQIFLGVINAGAPGQKIFTVIKTGNYTLIPIITTIFQCFCSSFWFIYGIVIEKYQIIIPNAIGILLTLFQIIVYFYFYGKNKDKNFNDDDDDNSNNYKDKNDYGRYYDQDSL